MKLQVVIPIYFRFYVWGLNTSSWHKRHQVAAQAPPAPASSPGWRCFGNCTPASRGDGERCGVREEGERDKVGVMQRGKNTHVLPAPTAACSLNLPGLPGATSALPRDTTFGSMVSEKREN